jgi:hypothetical protein
MNPNEAQVERHGPYHAGLERCAERPPTKTKPTRPEHRYFEAMAWFDSPDDATEAETALAAAGYAFEQTPYVFDEHDGFLISPTVYGVITGYTGVDESAVFNQLLEIVAPFGSCDACGFVDEPTSQAKRYKMWTGRSLADVHRGGVRRKPVCAYRRANNRAVTTEP